MRGWLAGRLTPMQRFAVVSFLCVVVVTVAVCGVGAEFLSRHLIEHDATLAGDLARVLLTRSLPATAFAEPAPDPSPYERAAAEIVAAAHVVRVVLYDLTGRVLWSDDPALIGRNFSDSHELEAALGGRISAHVVRPRKPHHQGVLRALERVEEIYIPVRYRKDGPVVGVMEIYRHPPAFFAMLDRGLAIVWALGGGGGLLLYVALCGVVRRGIRQRRYRSLEQRYRTLVETARDVVFTIAPDGAFQSLNPVFEVMTGWSPQEWIGRPFTALLHPDDVSGAMALLPGFLRGDRLPRCQVRVLARSGEYRTWEVTATRWLENSRVVGILGIARDIAERQRVEAAVCRLNETLEAEAARVARELHDEAGQLLAAAHIAVQDAAREVPAAAREGLREVEGVLDKIEQELRRLAHELRPTVLDDLGLGPALEFLAAGVARRAGLEVRVEGAASARLPPVVETSIYRVAQEALTNAVKHAGASTVTIHLERDGRSVRYVIADDGQGFDVAGALGRKGARGLGLPGIRNRVEALGGTLVIASAPDKGTVLTVTVPIGD